MDRLETMIIEYTCSLLGKSLGDPEKLVEIAMKEENSRAQRDFIVASALYSNDNPDRKAVLSDLFEPRAFFYGLLSNTTFELDNETFDSSLADAKVRKKVGPGGQLEYNVFDVIDVLNVFYKMNGF